MYTVIELQTTSGKTSVLPYVFQDKNVALQKFHTILAAAAVSSVEVHGAVILNELGLNEAREIFDRRPETPTYNY